MAKLASWPGLVATLLVSSMAWSASASFGPFTEFTVTVTDTGFKDPNFRSLNGQAIIVYNNTVVTFEWNNTMDSHSIQDCTDELFTTPGRPFCPGCSVQPTPIDTASDTEGFVQAVIGPPEEVRYFRDGDYPSYTLYVERIINVTTTTAMPEMPACGGCEPYETCSDDTGVCILNCAKAANCSECVAITGGACEWCSFYELSACVPANDTSSVCSVQPGAVPLVNEAACMSDPNVPVCAAIETFDNCQGCVNNSLAIDGCGLCYHDSGEGIHIDVECVSDPGVCIDEPSSNYTVAYLDVCPAINCTVFSQNATMEAPHCQLPGEACVFGNCSCPPGHFRYNDYSLGCTPIYSCDVAAFAGCSDNATCQGVPPQCVCNSGLFLNTSATPASCDPIPECFNVTCAENNTVCGDGGNCTCQVGFYRDMGVGPCLECVAPNVVMLDGTACGCDPVCTNPLPMGEIYCGSDGCGGVCGVCPTDYTCGGISCIPPCSPTCAERECGTYCGQNCGSCSVPDEMCSDGFCVCAPRCEVNTCGDDLCGGTCGECGSGESCVAGNCIEDGGDDEGSSSGATALPARVLFALLVAGAVCLVVALFSA